MAGTAEAMCSVWKAPATFSAMTLAFSGRSSDSAASCSVVLTATIWPAAVHVGRGQAELVQVFRHGLLVATEHGGHAGLADGRGLGHRQAAGPHDPHGLQRGQHPGERCGGQLTDAVAREGAHRAEGAGRVLAGPVVQQFIGGQQARRDQQRLGDGCVTDLLGVGLGAVMHQVEVDGGRPLGDPVGDAGKFEPGGQQARLLGALAGSDEYEHSLTLSCGQWSPPVGTETKNGEGNCGPSTKDAR